MSIDLLENLDNRSIMLETQQRLIEMGKSSLPILESILDGSAKNKFGISYNTLGLPLTSTLEIIAQLGDIAKPLEKYIQKELINNNPSALNAIKSFTLINNKTIDILVSCLLNDVLFSYEVASIIKKYNLLDHPDVIKVTKTSEVAMRIISKIKSA